jgi:recombination protein RecA
MPLLARLVKLAQKHEAAVLCLTDKHAEKPSLGSLVSLRCEATRKRLSAVDRFSCELRVLKDKRRGPGWQHQEVVRGPAGLV